MSVLGSRGTAIVIGAAVVLAAVAWLAVRARAPELPADGSPGEPFLPELSKRAEQLSRIEIEQGDRRAVLARAAAPTAAGNEADKAGDGGGEAILWTAPEKAGYPVEVDRVRDLVRGLASLEKLGKLTADPARHGELGLAWGGASERADEGAGATAGSPATVVRLYADGEAEPFAAVVLGRSTFSPRAIYVRRLDNTQTWKCAGEVSASADAVRFMDPVLASLPGNQLTEIVVEGAASQTPELILSREGDADASGAADGFSASSAWKLEGEAPDSRRSDAPRLLPDLFTRLEFDDVRAAPSEPSTPQRTIKALLGDRWVALELVEGVDEAEASGVATSTKPPLWFRVRVDGPSPGLGEQAPPEETLSRLETLERRAQGREFRMPSWRAGRVTTLLAPAPLPSSPSEAPEDAGAPGEEPTEGAAPE